MVFFLDNSYMSEKMFREKKIAEETTVIIYLFIF